jgi:hypothetical protein
MKREDPMAWRVMVSADGKAWDVGAVVPLDPSSDWVEASDEIVPGYRKAAFVTEAEANAAAQLMRAMGFISATERVP